MGVMERRQAIIAAQDGFIPPEYQRVEYIGSTGTQYIDSGIECTSDLCVEFKFLYSTTANSAICGGINLASAPVYFRHHCTPNGTELGYWIQNSSENVGKVYNTAQKDIVHVAFIDPVNGAGGCDGNITYFTPLVSGITTGKSYGIMARIANTGAVQSKSSQFYWFKFYKNECLIGNFIPCYKKINNEIGMYDTIKHQFHTNIGTGTFTKGTDI